MYQFAEAPVCRRKTVLFYFSEPYDRNCGNCDVCLNPPQQFDGTVAAQKALSAITRAQEKVGMNLLIDILRGSQRREIFENNFHQIKTYGAGKEFTYDDWLYLLSQMLHTGLIEIAYDAQNQLRVTDEGKKVLFDGKKVSLALPQPKVRAGKPGERGRLPHAPEKSKSQLLKEELFGRLVALRRSLAQQQGVPPYLIFSDASLDDMADKRPLTDADILKVSGMGERKLQLYGDAFIGEIRRFVLEKSDEGARVTGSTQLQTWELFKKGHGIEEIAQIRQMSTMSVMNHLAQMYERGETLDIGQWVSPEEIDMIQGALPLFEEPYPLKAIYEHFGERYNYDKIRFAIADYRRGQK